MTASTTCLAAAVFAAFVPGSPPATEDAAAARQDTRRAADALIDAVEADPGIVEALYGVSRSDALVHPLDSPARTDWSYWPRRREGLALRYMSAAQRTGVQELLAAVLSPRGYLRADHVMQLEEILATDETVGFSRSPADYATAVFGRPAADAPWGFRFEGHHLSINYTATPEGVSVTPAFIGAAPARIEAGPRAGFGPLRDVEAAAFALRASFDADQAARAVLAEEPPGDIVSSPFRRPPEAREAWRGELVPDGLPASRMRPGQRRLLRRLIDSVIGLHRAELAAGAREQIAWDDLHFAWMGAAEPGAPWYLRIQDERFLFEVDASQAGGDHIHIVWRDRENDFGADMLARHYRDHAH